MNSIAKTVLFKLSEEPFRPRTTIGLLSKEIGVSRRTIEQSIQELREEGYPICSDCHTKPYGIYMARTEQEAEQWYRQIYSRINRLFSILGKVKGHFSVDPRVKQLSLFVE